MINSKFVKTLYTIKSLAVIFFCNFQCASCRLFGNVWDIVWIECLKFLLMKYVQKKLRVHWRSYFRLMLRRYGGLFVFSTNNSILVCIMCIKVIHDNFYFCLSEVHVSVYLIPLSITDIERPYSDLSM